MQLLKKYYKSELNKLGKLKLNDSIQIRFEGKKTNFISLNPESLEVFKDYFNNLKL